MSEGHTTRSNAAGSCPKGASTTSKTLVKIRLKACMGAGRYEM